MNQEPHGIQIRCDGLTDNISLKFKSLQEENYLHQERICSKYETSPSEMCGTNGKPEISALGVGRKFCSYDK